MNRWGRGGVEGRGGKRRKKGGTGNAGTVIRFLADRLIIIGWNHNSRFITT